MANAGEDGTLELIREEPKLRLGCLELYVRLVDEGSGRDRFVVEEDVRQRVRVHWRSAAATGDAISWRVSCAFSPWESQVSISETLGREAVEWLWDGLNALILSVSQVSESALFGGGKSSLFGFCLQELCFRAVDRDRFRLGLSIWELRDTKAKDLLDPEEEAKQLRFDMVYFETPEQALSIWEAARSSASTRGGAAHVFVRVMLFDAQRPSMAALHFAEVAHSSDDASIQADHKALQQLLQDAVAPPAASSSRLLEVLSPLVRGNCKSFLLCTVPERPAHGAEARRLLDLAEQASMITANCHRLEGKHHEDFHWAAQEDVLRKLRMSRSSQMSNSPSSTIQRPGKRSPADDAAGGRSSPVRSPVLEASVSAGPNELDRLLEEALTSSHPPPPRGTKDLVEEPRSPEAKALHAQDLQRPPPPQPLSPKENQAREQWLLQEYHELAGAVAALRAKNKAKAHRRQRTLVEAKEEVKSFTEGVQEVEDAVAAPLLLQALRQERITLKDEVALLRKANGYLSGLHGEEKRRAAQKIAAKQLQQEARRLPTARQALQKGEKRAALVQRCLEEVHARWDSAKAGKLQAEEEIQRLRPNFEELGRQVEAVDAERRWLQGELDKLRQASGGIRAEILHLREVRDAVDALPPEDSTASKTSLGRGCLERFATLQRRLATAAPQLMPLCTRARAGMEELLQSCDRLEERQRRLQQVAPLKDPSAPPRGPAGPVAPGRRKGTSRGSSMERPRDLQRSRSAELSIARSVRSSRPVRSPGESIYRQEEADEANPTPRSIRHCCISCGASFMADDHFCQHCGCKRYPNLAKVEDRPPIKGPAGTLQDLGLDGDPKAHERVRDTLDRDTPNSVSKISYGSKLWPSPAWRK